MLTNAPLITLCLVPLLILAAAFIFAGSPRDFAVFEWLAIATTLVSVVASFTLWIRMLLRWRRSESMHRRAWLIALIVGGPIAALAYLASNPTRGRTTGPQSPAA